MTGPHFSFRALIIFRTFIRALFNFHFIFYFLSNASTSTFEPSITSTPILFQRLLAPIHENNRDQSPDIVIQRLRHKNSQSMFDGQSDEEMGGSGGSASFYLPRQTRQRTTSSHSVGGRIMSGSSSNQQQQLPPLPSSPEHQNVGGGSKFRIGSVGSRNSSTSSFVGGGNNRYFFVKRI